MKTNAMFTQELEAVQPRPDMRTKLKHPWQIPPRAEHFPWPPQWYHILKIALASLLVKCAMRTFHYIQSVLPGQRQQYGIRLPREVIIRLQNSHVFSGGGIHAPVHGLTIAAIRAIQNADTGISGGIFLQNLQTVIGRAIIHRYDLKIPAGLRQQTIQRLPQKSRCIVYRYNY